MENPNPTAPAPVGAVSQLIVQWSRGDEEALSKLMPLIYSELKRLASGYMRRERNAGTLQSTALIHEAYLRLAGGAFPDVRTKIHFFALAARVMRQVLVDHARTRRRAKRGGGAVELSLDEALHLSDVELEQVLELDEALHKLAERDERKARIVELRFFSGLEVREVAEVVGASENTVIRDWAFAKAWLQRALASPR